MNTLQLTWDNFDFAVGLMTDWCSMLERPPRSVFGVPRGGLPLAVALSHRADLPLVEVVTPDTLVVDDVVETGHTMHQFPQALAYFVWCTKLPTSEEFHHVRSVRADEWIIFPWEDKFAAQADAEAYYASRQSLASGQ